MNQSCGRGRLRSVLPSRTGRTKVAITTAAHCPDELTYVDRDGSTVTLPMIGSWGAAYRDVQINGSPMHGDAPFGGYKLSGIGRDGGKYAMSAYSELKYIGWTA